MKTAFEYGYEYAKAMQGTEGFDTPVNIEEIISTTGAGGPIPSGDYAEMRRAGVDPNEREYWKGYNTFFKEVA